MTNIDFG